MTWKLSWIWYLPVCWCELILVATSIVSRYTSTEVCSSAASCSLACSSHQHLNFASELAQIVSAVAWWCACWSSFLCKHFNGWWNRIQVALEGSVDFDARVGAHLRETLLIWCTCSAMNLHRKVVRHVPWGWLRAVVRDICVVLPWIWVGFAGPCDHDTVLNHHIFELIHSRSSHWLIIALWSLIGKWRLIHRYVYNVVPPWGVHTCWCLWSTCCWNSSLTSMFFALWSLTCRSLFFNNFLLIRLSSSATCTRLINLSRLCYILIIFIILIDCHLFFRFSGPIFCTFYLPDLDFVLRVWRFVCFVLLFLLRFMFLLL